MPHTPDPVHPCQWRKPLAPWRANHLYVDDHGQFLCGGCMGIESTYMPWAWSDLGAMDSDRTVTIDHVPFLCETDRYAVRRAQ